MRGDLSFLLIPMEECPSPPPQHPKIYFQDFCIQPNLVVLGGPYRLLNCSSKGDKNGVIQEIENGVSPNLADYDKRTALHLASCEGCTGIVNLLLEKGANVNSIDRTTAPPIFGTRIPNNGLHCSRLLREFWHKNPQYRPSFEDVIIQLETIQEGLDRKKSMGYISNCCSIL